MTISGDKQQDVLLIITVLLFLIFSTGSARDSENLPG